MSKIIKLTPEYLESYRSEFEDILKGKLTDGKIYFSKTLTSFTKRATVYFTSEAWTKMQALVRSFDKEVAWHGVAYRGEDEAKDEYYITDILVYPQEVSGATVEMDETKYDEWIRENVDDERFYNIGMQGHSHVDMQVSPSSVDINHQEIILQQLTDEMFYIFMIWNKSGKSYTKIYDLKKNILFENSDVDIVIQEDFIAEAKKMVTEKSYYAGKNHQSSYNDHAYKYEEGVYYYPGNNNKNKTTNGDNTEKKEEKVVGFKTSDDNKENKTRSTNKKRKGKKRKYEDKEYSHLGFSYEDYDIYM